MRFTKLHGIGNDFLVVGPGEIADPAAAGKLARRVCDRHTGVGADGLIVLSRETGSPAGFGFRIFNADGSEAEISGNGLRCAAAFMASSGLVDSPKVLVRTVAGDRPTEVISRRGRLFEVRIGLGTPRLRSAEIPFDDGRTYDRVIDYPLSVIRQTHPVTCVSLGNPHCSVFLDAFPSRGEWQGLGAEIETHPFFPKRTNVEFVRVRGRDEIEVLFWERGVGETLASGTGSAAAAVASMLKGLTGRAITVRSAIGSLKLEWPEGGEVYQTGPAEVVFTGEYPPD
jgi:diaminopimelate epimerase